MTDRPSRERHFAHFAALLLTEIDDAIGAAAQTEDLNEQQFADKLGGIIARRAYDLVWHTLETLPYAKILEAVIAHVPDMTVLPALIQASPKEIEAHVPDMTVLPEEIESACP